MQMLSETVVHRLASACRSTLTLVLGGRFERVLLPVLAIVGANMTAFGALMGYFGLWLIEARHADIGAVSTALLLAGLAGAAGAFAAGSAVDRYGARGMIVGISALHVLATAVLALPVDTWVGVGALVAIAGTQPLRGVAQRTLIGLLSDAGTGEKSFADFRLVLNVGLLCGPVLGAGLLLWGWEALRIGVCALYALSLLPAVALYRDRRIGAHSGTSTSSAAAPVPAASMLTDRRLLLLLAGSGSAWTIVYVYESLIPILVVSSHAVSASEWGLIYSLGPLLCLVGQFRVQRWFRGFSTASRLTGGVLLMGFAFSLFWEGFALGSLLLFIVAFVLGDMVWGPASEALVVRVAPEGRTGAYVGAVTSTMWVGSAVAPAVGLPAREHYGDGVIWIATAGLALVAAACYAKANQLVCANNP
ncbi:MFS transporter [Streptomyces prunicolor]|uniref:MFS transporter n=1 Tax=Streptomyces prunicolor TaxID=67348 RepID=UPI00036B1074|nr:MFS transporter [Streptomyces prunicolor]